MNKVISVRENSKLAEGFLYPPEIGITEVDQETFSQLSDFIDDNQGDSNIEHAFGQFRKNRRRYITTKNYVGIIQTKNGTILEVVPKLHRVDSELDISLSEAKSIVVKMFSALKDSPFISIGEAQLNSSRDMPLMEIFIKSFIHELESLLRKELRSGYQIRREESKFIKGKVLIEEQLRMFSPARVEFICEYDVFTVDVSPNRLIKSVLLRLIKLTNNSVNEMKIRKHLEKFEGISDSKDIKNDFAYCKQHGFLLKNYEKLLSWCEVILDNKGFSNYRGDSVNLAILFPMEKLFENYVAFMLSKYANDMDIRLQDRRFYLVNEFRKGVKVGQFQLRPDVVLSGNKIILDTKWKILEDSKSHFNISERDIYQMYAYGKRYQSETVGQLAPKLFLVYPRNVLKNEILPSYVYGDDMSLDVLTFDLLAENQYLETMKLIGSIT